LKTAVSGRDASACSSANSRGDSSIAAPVPAHRSRHRVEDERAQPHPLPRSGYRVLERLRSAGVDTPVLLLRRRTASWTRPTASTSAPTAIS
jgi:hypothetical protein